MIKVTLPKTDHFDALIESHHVAALRRDGVPMRGNSLFEGVESGVLSCSEDGTNRTYIWSSELEKKPSKRFLEWLSPHFRIHQCTNLGEQWYEVSEWNWYWPFWGRWTHCVSQENPERVVTKFYSAYQARQTIIYRNLDRNNLTETIIERL